MPDRTPPPLDTADPVSVPGHRAPPTDTGFGDGPGRGGQRPGEPSPAALLLADGRFPTGGHAHSGGVEPAVADRRVTGPDSLEAFLQGRLATAGLTDAALAAATRLGRAGLDELDAECEARLAAPPLRAASRRQGRQLVRAGSRCWPAPVLVEAVDRFPDGAHLPVAWGVVGIAARLDAPAVVRLVLHHTVTTAAQAAVRLLGLDPFEVAAITARLSSATEAVADEALAAAAGPVDRLPARSAPLTELAAVAHHRWDTRLFAT